MLVSLTESFSQTQTRLLNFHNSLHTPPQHQPWIDYGKFYPGFLKSGLGSWKISLGNSLETLWSKYCEPIVMNENIIHALKHVIIINTNWGFDITN